MRGKDNEICKKNTRYQEKQLEKEGGGGGEMNASEQQYNTEQKEKEEREEMGNVAGNGR